MSRGITEVFFNMSLFIFLINLFLCGYSWVLLFIARLLCKHCFLPAAGVQNTPDKMCLPFRIVFTHWFSRDWALHGPSSFYEKASMLSSYNPIFLSSEIMVHLQGLWFWMHFEKAKGIKQWFLSFDHHD